MTANQPSPGRIGTDWTSVSGFSVNACAINSERDLYCWGQNSYGQDNPDHINVIQWAPVRINQLSSVETASANVDHNCAIGILEGEAERNLYCWGDNRYGRLGDGTLSTRLTPAKVAGTELYVVVSVGQLHTCAITGAGKLHCWGQNLTGALGIGTSDSNNHPNPESVKLNSEPWTVVSTGNQFTCGISQTTGYCWGRNQYGQLGVGHTDDVAEPTNVSGGIQFRSLTTNRTHACGIDTNHKLYCWGQNNQGQVGNHGTINMPSPAPTAQHLDFRLVSAGVNHTCGILLSGSLYCWGAGSSGQLGDGRNQQYLAPEFIGEGWESVLCISVATLGIHTVPKEA